MRLSREVPTLFQETSNVNTDYCIEFRRLAIHSHDVVFYFADLTMKEDVICATPQPDYKHYCYENEKLACMAFRCGQKYEKFKIKTTIKIRIQKLRYLGRGDKTKVD